MTRFCNDAGAGKRFAVRIVPKISRPNGHRTRTLTPRWSYPSFLVKKCIVTILLLWVGLVVVFLSQLPRHNNNYSNAAISPLSARDNLLPLLRAPPYSHENSIVALSGSGEEQSNHRPSREIARGWIASYLVSKLPEFANRKTESSPHRTFRENQGRRRPFHKQKLGVSHPEVAISRQTGRKQVKSNQQSPHNRIANALMPKLSFLNQNNASAEENAKQSRSAPSSHLRLPKPQIKKKEQLKIESTGKSTRDALISSEPHAQKFSDVSQSHVRSISAFFSEDYFNSESSMGSDDDSLDTYYAADDDTIRGSGYKKRPDGHEPICRTPSFYRLYRPTCNELHSVASGYHWLTGGDGVSKNYLSRYLGSGAYRQVFLLERQFTSNSDEVILKSMKRFPVGEGELEKRAGELTHTHHLCRVLSNFLNMKFFPSLQFRGYVQRY